MAKSKIIGLQRRMKGIIYGKELKFNQYNLSLVRNALELNIRVLRKDRAMVQVKRIVGGFLKQLVMPLKIMTMSNSVYRLSK